LVLVNRPLLGPAFTNKGGKTAGQQGSTGGRDSGQEQEQHSTPGGWVGPAHLLDCAVGHCGQTETKRVLHRRLTCFFCCFSGLYDLYWHCCWDIRHCAATAAAWVTLLAALASPCSAAPQANALRMLILAKE
jgi:hypothetical protein